MRAKVTHVCADCGKVVHLSKYEIYAGAKKDRIKKKYWKFVPFREETIQGFLLVLDKLEQEIYNGSRAIP